MRDSKKMSVYNGIRICMASVTLIPVLSSCGSPLNFPAATTTAGVPVATATPGPASKKLFIEFTHTGSLGGIAGADNLCNTSANRPDTAKTYKALIVGGGRTACTTANCSGGVGEHTDWVLTPSTYYSRGGDGMGAPGGDGAIIGQTDANGLFTFPLTNKMDKDGVGMGGGQSQVIWTGLNADWTTAANTCTGWTSANAAQYGAAGASRDLTSAAINDAAGSATGVGSANYECDWNTGKLYCVEQ